MYRLIPLVLLFFVALVRPVELQADEAGARAFIREFGDFSIKELTDKSLSEDELRQRFERLYRMSFDSASIAAFVMGRHWRKMSANQRSEFIDLFEKFIVKTYSSRFRKYNGETFDIIDARPEKNDIFVVVGQVRRNVEDPPIGVEWRVGKKGDSYKLYDITVEGVSMSITQRSEFASVIKNSGGIDGLINALRKKTAALE